MLPREPEAYQLRKGDYKIGFWFISDLTCKFPFCLPGIQLRLLEVKLENLLLLFSLSFEISLNESLFIYFSPQRKLRKKISLNHLGLVLFISFTFLFRFLREPFQRFLVDAF